MFTLQIAWRSKDRGAVAEENTIEFYAAWCSRDSPFMSCLPVALDHFLPGRLSPVRSIRRFRSDSVRANRAFGLTASPAGGGKLGPSQFVYRDGRNKQPERPAKTLGPLHTNTACPSMIKRLVRNSNSQPPDRQIVKSAEPRPSHPKADELSIAGRLRTHQGLPVDIDHFLQTSQQILVFIVQH